MQMPRIEVEVRHGLNVDVRDVLLHEYPLIVATVGGNSENVRFIRATGETNEIEDFHEEYDRLVRAYRTDGSNEPQVHVAFGDAMNFATQLQTQYPGPMLKTLRAAWKSRTVAKQPNPGDDGYLDKRELVRMLRTLGETAEEKTRRPILRTSLILALDAALTRDAVALAAIDADVPALETDPQIGEAYALWLQATGTKERGPRRARSG